MIAYRGTDPFVFFSYAHADLELVEKIIIGLKQKLCRVWYDEGLVPGRSWNDELAEQLLYSEVVVVMLTHNAAESPYIKTEINYAISKGKQILPVLLEDFEMPAGLELMLSSIRLLRLSEHSDVNRIISEIAAHLPRNVFAFQLEPFFETETHAFFLETDCQVNGSASDEKRPDRFQIICRRREDGEEKALFSFCGTAAYDVRYSVTQCVSIHDDYFVGDINGIHIINVLAHCELDYPLFGPDFDLLLILALRIPDDEWPTIRLIDYQYTHVLQSKTLEGKRVGESAWGRGMEEKCRRLLYAESLD